MTNKLINLRHNLHQKPELSGSERLTSRVIVDKLKKFEPDSIIENLGGYGVLARFNPRNKDVRHRIMIRAELDAIAVNEETEVDYRSETADVMHGCGHDGHMAILIGVAEILNQNRPGFTEINLLFQPAEETGEGAGKVLADNRFKALKIDHGYALHNLPGFDEGVIVIKDGVFACASVGVEITFRGRSSHAAYPEQGINPAASLTNFLSEIHGRFDKIRDIEKSTKAVTTYIHLGERAFGISPGIAKAGFTIRSADDDVITEEVEWFRKKINDLRGSFPGDIEIKVVEPFTSTVNNKSGNHILQRAATRLDMDFHYLNEPFPWSEDFGSFKNKFPITLFGLGAGLDHPPLHSEKYDFNDRLIEKGIELYTAMIELVDDAKVFG